MSVDAQTKAAGATNPTQMNRSLVKLLWPMLLCLATQSYAQSAGPTFPDPGKPHMSRDQQRALGLQVAAKAYEQMPVLPDSSPETQYIRQLGQKLVATIPPEHSWPFEFHEVAQKEINAFALPGGPMFVNLGTLTAAANEAPLAGVMGHECRTYTCSTPRSRPARRRPPVCSPESPEPSSAQPREEDWSEVVSHHAKKESGCGRRASGLARTLHQVPSCFRLRRNVQSE
jgi:hypothetical protein